MYRKCNRVLGLTLVSCVILASVLTSSCTSEQAVAVPPFIPPAYYEALQVNPQSMLAVYFTGYADYAATDAFYRDMMFVFKDVLVEERTTLNLDDGFIWVDMIRCYLVNPEDMARFKIGDRIDVVGKCGGAAAVSQAQLRFNECLVISAGVVALPKDPDAGSITPGY